MQNLAYGYDAASNITSIGDNLAANRSQTFAYDNLNRLTAATGLYGTNTYAYDAVGNRTQKTVTVPFASTDTYTTPATSNRLGSISSGTARTLTYTASGQAATDQRSPLEGWTYTTDKAGRMSAAVLNGVTQTTTAYDADELRIVNTNALTGHVTHYVYDAAGQLIAEMDGATGNPIREYIWLGALPIGYVDRLGSGGASRLFFVHADHLARPQKITDSARAVVWDGVFAPFGEVHAITGSIVNVLMFPGQVYDPETGLSQNWHGDYDANIGRYLQSDPIGLEGGINTYAYVGGNPLTHIDPYGLSFSTFPDPRPAYEFAREMRTAGHDAFPGEANSAMRHCFISCVLGRKIGNREARAFGIGNEVQGYFFHDIFDPYGRLTGRRPWAFQPDDLRSNELGFGCAGCGTNNRTVKSCLSCCRTMTGRTSRSGR